MLIKVSLNVNVKTTTNNNTYCTYIHKEAEPDLLCFPSSRHMK